MSAFDEAKDIVENDRQDTRGNPDSSFAAIAGFWNEYLGARFKMKAFLTAEDVALMMALLKVARETQQHERDNLVDAIGYLGIAADRLDGVPMD